MIPIRDVIPSRTRPVVTVSLIALNVLVFLFQSSLSERGLELFLLNFAVIPADFSLVTVFTAMFLHAGVAHLAGNMLFLWIFGDNIEDRLGHGRFIGFYVICGCTAAIAQTALDPGSRIPMVGSWRGGNASASMTACAKRRPNPTAAAPPSPSTTARPMPTAICTSAMR